MEALGINLGYLLVQIIAFIVLYTLLSRFLYTPLVNTLNERRTRIQRGLEDSAAAANARRNAEVEAEKIIAAARTEAARVIEDARGRGEEVARTIEAEARAEAERIRAEGGVRANEERDRQLADLRGQVASIATAMAQRLIGESLDAKRQQALVNDFFTRVPATDRKLTGAVTVTSAMPLTPDEQQRIQRELRTDVAAFTVDPSILGGLVVRGEDRVIDGSVRSNLQELAGRFR